MTRDLFGRRRRIHRTRAEIYLHKYDRDTYLIRLERLEWISKVFPKGSGMLAPPETVYIFDEIKMTYLNGQHISTILLAAAFLEHWLSGRLRDRGYIREAERGLKSIIECMRKHSLLDTFLLRKADRLRKIRNPFVHMKECDHEARIFRRALKERTDPFILLERDAREAITLVFEIVTRVPG